MQLTQWQKKHKFLVCVDSDGTALDTMNIKHIRCFGPCFVRSFGLETHAEECLRRWNEINLYEKTRGNNRFITLLQILREYNGKYLSADLTKFALWVESCERLSGNSLRSVAEASGDEVQLKALAWSDAVDASIARLTPADKPPFDGVKECFEYLAERADIAVVSSAGAAALNEEWKYYGLDGLVGVMTSQEDGSKDECIKAFIAKGYSPRDILMVGDSFPDIEAAKSCGVWFYPILAGNETESWHALKKIFLPSFLSGTYEKEQPGRIASFYKNLDIEG